MATLYLHIGTPKTGSTAIQQFCRINRRALEARGFCYARPALGEKRNGMFLREAAFRPDGTLETAEGERHWRLRMDAVCRNFRRCPNVLLSEEGAWRAKSWPGLWRRLRAEADARGFDLRVIVYLRRQDQFFLSWWAQAVKTNHCVEIGRLPWSEALAEAEQLLPLNYHEHLEEIAALLGRDRIDVRRYDRARFPGGDVTADFLSALKLSPEGFDRFARDINTSLSGDTLAIKRAFNARPNLSTDTIEEAAAVALACERQGGEAPGSLFDRRELEAFQARFEESNRRVARDYLGTDAPLFDPPGELPPKWEPDAERIMDTAARFIQLALDRGGSPRMLLKRLRRRISREKSAALRRLGARAERLLGRSF